MSTTEIFQSTDNIQNRILIVPGNHEVDRGHTDSLEHFRERFSEFLHPFTDSSDGVRNLAPIFVFKELKLVIACISTVDNSATESELISDTIEFIKNIGTDKTNSDDIKRRNELIKKLNKAKIKDIPSILSKTIDVFITNNKKLKAYKDYKRIIISHHPLLSGFERATVIKEYPNTIGGYKLLDIALNNDYSLFIHGHTHEFSCFEIRDKVNRANDSAFQLGVPNFNLEKDDGLQVVLLNIDNENNDITIKLLSLDLLSYDFKEEKHILAKNNQPDGYTIMPEGVLMDYEIIQLINDGKIVKNGDISRVNSTTYDCALARQYKISTTRYDWEDKLIEPSIDGPSEIIIQPGTTILIYTDEVFDVPKDMIMHASPKASIARKGLRVELGHFIEPGFKGAFCFPITNLRDYPITLSVKEPIMAVEFVKTGKTPNKSWIELHPESAIKRERYEDS